MSRTSEAPLALAEGAAARSAVTTTAKAIANLALRRMRPGEANRSSWAGEKTHRRGARRCGGRERNLNGITPSPCPPWTPPTLHPLVRDATPCGRFISRTCIEPPGCGLVRVCHLRVKAEAEPNFGTRLGHIFASSHLQPTLSGGFREAPTGIEPV